MAVIILSGRKELGHVKIKMLLPGFYIELSETSAVIF